MKQPMSRCALALFGLSALPKAVLAHDGQMSSLWHAVLHMVQANGVLLVVAFVAVVASLGWQASQRRRRVGPVRIEESRERRHDSR